MTIYFQKLAIKIALNLILITVKKYAKSNKQKKYSVKKNWAWKEILTTFGCTFGIKSGLVLKLSSALVKLTNANNPTNKALKLIKFKLLLDSMLFGRTYAKYD